MAFCFWDVFSYHQIDSILDTSTKRIMSNKILVVITKLFSPYPVRMRVWFDHMVSVRDLPEDKSCSVLH